MADFSVTTTAAQTNQQQWLRQCKLVVSNGGSTFDLSNLRVKFRVQSATVNTLKSGEITVYNLSPTTAQAIFTQKEFDTLTLSAGYKNATCATILAGSIVYMRMGREDALTSYLTMIATDGDPHNWATINIQLLAGQTTPQQQLNQILAALKPYGITKDHIDQKALSNNSTLSRGKAMYGSVRQVLDAFASSLGLVWNIEDNKLNLFDPADTNNIWGDVFTLTPQSGLVGVPELTLDGLTARCLLNPAIRQGSLVQIPTQYITQTFYSQTQSQPNLSVPVAPSLSTNSVYRVYALTNVGDTRGTGMDWYSDLICVPTQGTLPISNTYLSAVQT